MTEILSLTVALSAEEPCGPDLDEVGDGDYEEFMALADGFMPTSFFNFDSSSINLDNQLETISTLLGRSRDLRILSIAARFSILTGSIVQFANCLEAMSTLLDEQWDFVHPQGNDNDFQYRLSQLQALDDMISVVLPLQFSTLLQSRRHGKISYRHKLVADGKSQAREGEGTLDVSTILDAIANENDIDDLLAAYAAIGRIAKALKSINQIFVLKTDHKFVPNFGRLDKCIQEMIGFLTEALSNRDPALVEGYTAVEREDGVEGDEPVDPDGLPTADLQPATVSDQPAIFHFTDAKNALQVVEDYFARNEPSNPSLLVIRQAQELVGKSFIEAMEVLLPGQVDNASVLLDAGKSIQIPISRLRNFSTPESQTTSTDDDSQTYLVPTRSDALALIDSIELFFRQKEPSSPIPLLLSRTKHFSNKDFSALIKDLVTETNQTPDS